MTFYLGVHRPNWLEQTRVPLFVSWRTLKDRKRLPRALGPWGLDSGGFTELSLHGRFETTPEEYAKGVDRLVVETGNIRLVSPQDWMCEPFMLTKTGLTIHDHQLRTVQNFLRLRNLLGEVLIPVLQGWTQDDYLRCWDLYERHGVTLEDEWLVGLGSVCRRQNMAEAGLIVRSLVPLKLHGYGVKLTGLESFSDVLDSADSMAWSYAARKEARHGVRRSCGKRSCANCLHYALSWRNRVVEGLGQLRLEAA